MTSKPPLAHRDLFATARSTTGQAQLFDYSPELPTPEDDPDQDLTAPSQAGYSIKKTLANARVGSVVTINTVYQGTVAEVVDVAGAEKLAKHVDADRLAEYDLDGGTRNIKTIYWVDVANLGIDTLAIVAGDITVTASERHWYSVKRDGEVVQESVDHLAVDNENNLKEEVDVPRYETLKAHTGEQVLLFEESTSMAWVATITGYGDGVINYCKGDPDEKRELSHEITCDATPKTWVLSSRTDAGSVSVLRGEADPFAGADVSDLEDSEGYLGKASPELHPEQEDAVATVLETLPTGSYFISDQGIHANWKIPLRPSEPHGEKVGHSVDVLSAEVTNAAFPAADYDEDTNDHEVAVDFRAPERDPVDPTDDITSIIGIGDATAADISGIGRDRSKSACKRRLEDSDIVEMTELDDDERKSELVEAEKEYNPNDEVASTTKDLMTVQDFINQGPSLFKASSRYYSRAVAEVVATLASEDEITEKGLLRVHAGATNARLYDSANEQLGHLANLHISQLSIDEVETAAAWTGQKHTPPFEAEWSDRAHILTTDLPDELDVGRDTYCPAEPRPGAATVDHVGVAPLNDIVVFTATPDEHTAAGDVIEHEDLLQLEADSETPVHTACVDQTAVEYVNALFGLDLADPADFAHHARITPEGHFYVRHPDDNIDLTYAAPFPNEG